MSSKRGGTGRRFEPDARVVGLVGRYGTGRVARKFGFAPDTLRRYLDGASQPATRAWFELHADTVTRDLRADEAPRPKLLLVHGGAADPATSTPPTPERVS